MLIWPPNINFSKLLQSICFCCCTIHVGNPRNVENEILNLRCRFALSFSRWSDFQCEEGVHVFTRLGNGLVLVWLSRQSHWGNVSNSGAYLWLQYRVRTYFEVLGSSNIKHLYPSEVSLALSRTTRPHSFHSSTTNLKCTKLYDYYEYGLENSTQSLTNAARVRRGNISVHAFCQRIIKRKIERSRSFMYASYKRLIVIILRCFVEHFATNKLQFFAHKLGP